MSMSKISIGIIGVLLCATALLFITQEKRGDTVYRVGVLSALDYFLPIIDGFKEQMTALGYVEGENIVYDIQKAPSPVGNHALAQKFVDDGVDLILVFPTEASLETKQVAEASGIPIISVGASVEGSGLIETVQNPGGNVTGVLYPIRQIAGKRLEILHQFAPRANRILVPHLKDYPTVPVGIDSVQGVATRLGLTLILKSFASPDELSAYLKQQSARREFDAVVLIPEPLSIVPAFVEQLYTFAYMHDIPIAGAEVLSSDRGPVFSLIPGSVEMGRLAAPLAEKIFKGIAPGSIPMITPELVFEINYKRATKIGLQIEESLLSTADRIVR
jgi:putative tryptophan/tyrosine transport system substrate-binding protein